MPSSATPCATPTTPTADVGLPDYGTRRVPGLRREEVAVLAGVSVPYYTRLERGDLSGASPLGPALFLAAGQNPYDRELSSSTTSAGRSSSTPA